MFHVSSVSSVGVSSHYSDNNMYSLWVKSPNKICEYIDELYISGKYKDIGMLVIDKEFEEKLSGIVEFKTLDEFKEVK
jgi:hypothetical protein